VFAALSGSMESRGRRRAVAGAVVAGLVLGLYVATSGPGHEARAAGCETESPDARSAAAMAAACGFAVENLAGRSEFTQAFANPDGTSTFKSTAVPARVRRTDGTWAAVDPTLAPRADGSYAPRATLADVSFSGGGTAPFVTYKQGATRLTLGWPTALPAPTVSGDTAVYAEVLSGVDLRVTATSTGFTHVLVVKTASAASNPALASIRSQVGGDGVVKANGDGRVRFADTTGHTIAASQNALMWDSGVHAGAGGEVMPGVDMAALVAQHPADFVSTDRGPGSVAFTSKMVLAAGSNNGLLITPDVPMLVGGDSTFPVYLDPAIGPTRTKWAWANSGNANYAVNGQAWIGKNPPANGGDGRLYRSFFDFPTTYNGQTYKGKHVLAASFSIKLDHSYSCGNTTVNLYRTSAITVGNGARMPWATRPLGSGAKWLASASGHANEAGGCGVIQPDLLMTFGGTETMRADVQAAATANQGTYTVGLCTCDSDGTDEATQDRWKRFLVDGSTTMSVTFNTVPGPPANLSPHQGQVACGGVVGTYSPVLQAQYVDGDGSDTLTSTFAWQQLPSGAVTNVAGTTKPANNNGTATLNLGSAAEGKSYQFQVRTNDGHDASPWSPWCQFLVDTVAPPAPGVTAVASGSAPVYASCAPASIATCAQNGGPGVSGSFRLTSPAGGEDVVKYVYGWDSASIDAVLPTPGAAYTLPLTPPRYGLNTLVVYSVDGSGKKSPTTTYTFLVAAPADPVASWPLDSIAGHNYSDVVGGRTLTPTGDVTWTPDARLIGTNALSFDANATDGQTGFATTSGPVLDTTKSFSVSAWVRVTDLSAVHVAVSQDGTSRSRFMLYYSSTYAKWIFGMYDVDSAVDTGSFAMGGTPVAGRWTHLLGVYDASLQKISLYVNGTLAQTTTHTGSWAATGPFVVGRAKTGGAAWVPFKGDIADVRAWNRVVVPDDISGTDANTATGVPSRAGILAPPEVGSWQFGEGECFCANAGDDSPFARRVGVFPNWSLDPNWSGDPATTPAWLTADSHDGNGGLQLDGVSGYAATTDDRGTLDAADDVQKPVLRTDQSFTVAAWAKLGAFNTTADEVLLRQGTGTHAAFKLFVRAADNKWSFTVSTPDGAGSYTWVGTRSDVAAELGTWVHVVGTFDAANGQVRLYVNGVVQAWGASGGVGWPTTGSLQIGKPDVNGFFGGTVDQVHAWQGVLSAREIKYLYTTS
jgi:hypothetical protein